MSNFLKSLFGTTHHKEPIQPPASSAHEICQLIDKTKISSHTKLIVDAGQVAVMCANGERSTLYPTGEHRLLEREKAFLSQHTHAEILFIQTAPPVSRQWSLLVTSIEDDPLQLQGSYTVAVENAKVFCDNLMQNNGKLSSATVDDWIHKLLKEVIQAQHIKAEDIEHHRHKLEQFLVDALNPILFDKGLALRALTIEEQKTSSSSLNDNLAHKNHEVDYQAPAKDTSHDLAEELSIEPDPDQPDMDDNKTNVSQEETSPTFATEIDTGPKIFYRVLNGHQDGPYSVYQMQQLIEKQALKPTDLIWKKGFSSWQRADTIEQFVWSDG